MARRFFIRLLSVAGPAGDHVPDADLLRRFARDHDPAAFELLARRHAPAVWAACRRILRSEADAEDAFQAAFLVLARKAGAVRGACVGGWLHRVAVHAALRTRERSARAAAVSPRHLDTVPALPADEPDADLAAVVQEELGRLPERYRLPVVLCDLEGQTHAEAAKALGWPIGSVSGRLSRAHALLRDRLTRRGLAPVVGAVVVLPAAGPPAGAVAAAVAAAVGTVPVPLPVAALTEGVLSAMRTAKLKLTTAVVAAVGLLGVVGAGTVLAWPRTDPPVGTGTTPDLPLTVAAPVPPEPPIEGNWLGKEKGGPIPTVFPSLKDLTTPNRVVVDLTKACPRLFGENALSIDPADDTYRRLLKARFQQGADELHKFYIRVTIGQYQSTEFAGWVMLQEDMRAVAAELWADDPKNLIPRLEELVVMAKESSRFTQARVEAGTDPPQQAHTATRNRLAAEALLWKAKHGKLGGR